MFKIIHLSDIHYSSKPKNANMIDFMKAKASRGHSSAVAGLKPGSVWGPKSHCPDIALGVAQFLANHLHDHHIMLLSGDIATTGIDADLKASFDFVNSKPSENFPYRTLSGSPTLGMRKNIAVMPGNHDRFQDEHCAPNGSLFDKYFSRQWGSTNKRVRTFIIRDISSKKVLHMIAGDFCLHKADESMPSGWPFCCGQGTVHQSILQEMCLRTEWLRDNRPQDGIIWISHFPPTGKLAGLKPDSHLNGYGDVILKASKYNIQFILSGHIHRNEEFYESGVRILTVGSACSFLEPNGNWIRSLCFTVESGAVVLEKISNYEWNSKLKLFR